MHVGSGYFCSGCTIGQGAFSTVWRVVRDDGRHFACKRMPDCARTDEEVSHLKRAQGLGVVRLIDVVRHASNVNVIMELCNDGDMLSVAATGTERRKREVVRLAFDAVARCHDRGVAHRDVKPENFGIVGNEVRLLDFGLAARIGPLTGLKGSTFYVAPEVISNVSPYDARCDVWSAGVLAYCIASGGVLPFEGNSRAEVFAKIRQGQFSSVGCDKADDLLRGLLRRNPEERASLRDALAHPWFEDVTAV